MNNRRYTNKALLDNIIKTAKAAKNFEIGALDMHLSAIQLIVVELKQRNNVAKDLETQYNTYSA